MLCTVAAGLTAIERRTDFPGISVSRVGRSDRGSTGGTVTNETTVPDLLDLLASAEERAQLLAERCERAEADGARTSAEASFLRRELEGMTASLLELQGQLDAAKSDLARAEAQAASRHQEMMGEVDRARESERRLLEELDRIRQSRSWRITAPLRGKLPS
jgi:chromosome segregation ATPase